MKIVPSNGMLLNLTVLGFHVHVWMWGWRMGRTEPEHFYWFRVWRVYRLIVRMPT